VNSLGSAVFDAVLEMDAPAQSQDQQGTNSPSPLCWSPVLEDSLSSHLDTLDHDFFDPDAWSC